MCGRYSILFDRQKLENSYNLAGATQINRNINTSPGQLVPVIIIHNDHLIVKQMLWGLVPHWRKADDTTIHKLINARAETIAKKPSFKQSFITKRCLIPVSGFYEWQQTTKQPFLINLKQEIFCLAGIWDSWQTEDNSLIESCSIITIAATANFSKIHHRLPAIIADDVITTWLDNKTQDTLKLTNLLYQSDYNQLQIMPINKKINNASNHDLDIQDLMVL